MWTEEHASALQAVFSALNESGLEWMVLRNYEGLPDKNRSKDIDLLVEKKDFKKASEIISDALKIHRFTIYSQTRFQYVWCFTFFDVTQSTPVSIKIDLLDGFAWRGAQIVDFTDLYARKVRYSDFFVTDPIYDGLMLWAKPLMTGGFIKEKYRIDICRTLEAYPQEFYALLKKTVGVNTAKSIWSHLANGELDATIPYQRQLCRSAWLVALSNDLVRTISATVEHVYREMGRRARRPVASMVAVIGPDGAGKSTFIELLQKALCRVLVKESGDVCVLHFRPNIFPNLKKLLSGREYDEKSEEFTSPHRVNPAGRVSSFLRLVYYWLDYLFGYWLHIRRRCVAGKVYIFDRYCYDFIVDPYRSRIKLPEWLRLLFLKMTPEPDVVFFLNCDAETIYERKQELTYGEIERQLQAYRKLVTRSRRFVVLDAEKKPEELCSDAVRQIIEKSFPTLTDIDHDIRPPVIVDACNLRRG